MYQIEYYLYQLLCFSPYSELGKLVDVWMIAIHQNGGFTQIWLSLKTIFFPAILLEMIWMYRRLGMLPRNPTLLEKMLLGLGGTLTLLNLPMEYLTLYFDMPWINLFNDIKQGIFYAALMAFWLVFAGEHLINDDDSIGKIEKCALKKYEQFMLNILAVTHLARKFEKVQ